MSCKTTRKLMALISRHFANAHLIISNCHLRVHMICNAQIMKISQTQMTVQKYRYCAVKYRISKLADTYIKLSVI